jgi:cellulose synthase/poly-beta-1,6-N-acetylglucosamine synthase-like glycosyltransferase
VTTSTVSPDGLISVIIPAYNATKTLPACLEALQRQTIGAQRYEVIVVDDGSTDGSADVARHFGVRLIRQPHRGAAAARNAGVAAARGSIVLFTDADCSPAPDWIEQMIRPLMNPLVDGVKGAYRTRQRSLIARFTQLEYEDRYDRTAARETIDFVDTYAAAYRRDVLLAAGGFDEGFPGAAVEDADLSYRLAAQGHRLIFNPHAIVYHHHPTTLQSYLRRKAIYGYWRVPVYMRYPAKTGGDAHTPLVLKWQLLLAATMLVLLPFAWWLSPARWMWLAASAVFIATTLPFVLKALRRDPSVALVCIPMLWLRAVAIGFGLVYGLVRFVLWRYLAGILRTGAPRQEEAPHSS